MVSIAVREFSDRHRPWARSLLLERWGSARVVTRGELHQADRLPGFVAQNDGNLNGLITYRIQDRDCEIVTLDSLKEGYGIGTALLNTVKAAAKLSECRRVWLITTNDNVPAQRFYQNRGLSIVAIHKNAVDESRKLKPEIPLTGYNDIPIRDEIEFEMKLELNGDS